MKKLFLSLLLLSAFYVSAQQNGMHSPIETIITDLNSDGKTDTISISLPPVEGDPGTFRRITISLGTKGRNTFTAKDTWAKADPQFLRNNTNAIKSDLVFVHKEAKQTFVLLFGFAYGSGREEIAILSIKENKIEQLIDNQLEEPIRFIDLDNDGKAELVCQNPPEIYQTDSKAKTGIGTYSPFLVYKCDNVLYLDKKLTEEYNRQHYVWAGYKYNENIKVSYPKIGRPQIIK